MKVICINDSLKPNDIKSSEWIVKGNKYTVIDFGTSLTTGDKWFKLAEISISNPLYKGYNVNRFAIPVDLDVLVENEQLIEENV